MELLLAGYRRLFILFSNTGVTAPVFSEKTLATEGGRMDVVARGAMYAIWDTERPREDTAFIAVLNGPPNPPLTLVFRPTRISLSEVSIGAEILRALRGESKLINIVRLDILSLLGIVKRLGFLLVLLIEGGEDIASFSMPLDGKITFILGDHIGFPVSLLKSLEGVVDARLSLGRVSYLGSHCIAFVNEILDALS
ncbi:hypothetical protein IG193_05250 [Infirmifilum lucidum]|uniref:tRNA (pseudouridine(54)-N(1))-methyltransferase n=1 Tax=Infirmifilum lucidum TaxID=2776706 RepID=A0A7L9FEM7_9CREN|nr:hypothetical protein [Infirmifilum lucidum]QOJ78189.1 hypothetical protein IG193_05250 [Infirmifilum lucidum]